MGNETTPTSPSRNFHTYNALNSFGGKAFQSRKKSAAINNLRPKLDTEGFDTALS